MEANQASSTVEVVGGALRPPQLSLQVEKLEFYSSLKIMVQI